MARSRRAVACPGLTNDDGNDDQCALDHDGGSAWLTLSVTHGTGGPMPGLHPRPFDLVPTGYDSNLLFRDPVWGWQANQGKTDPDGYYFKQCAGPEPCTDQAIDEDRIGWDLFEIFGLCGGDPPTGHRNWFPTLLGQPRTTKATVTCTDADRHTCTWSVPPPPGIGTYKVTMTATDRAGNKETAGNGIHITVGRLLL